MCVKNNCPVNYKILECAKQSLFELYIVNEHPEVEADESQLEDNSQRRRGVSNQCKKQIETIIFSKHITKPSEIMADLTLNNSEYKITDLPTLKQIQEYMKYRSESEYNVLIEKNPRKSSNSNTCTCDYYRDKGVCPHIASAIKEKKELLGYYASRYRFPFNIPSKKVSRELQTTASNDVLSDTDPE
jgi:hypothetical protein